MGIAGPAGGGKTKSALLLAFGLVGDWSKIAVVDAENHSAALYNHLGGFKHLPLEPPYDPQKYVAAIHAAEEFGYQAVILDTISHAWSGAGGLLEMVDKKKAAGVGSDKSSFFAWREASTVHNQFVDAIVNCKIHIICTMRSKTRYAIDEQDGKATPKKLGMEPVVREGMDYELDLCFDVEAGKHIATVSKDRTEVFDGYCDKITVETGKRLLAWLNEEDVAPLTASQGKEEYEVIPETDKRRDYFDRLRVALTTLHGEDRAAKLATVERESAVPAKNGYAALPGVHDYRELSDKRLSILVRNIEKLAKAAMKKPDPDAIPEGWCETCHGALARDGSCPTCSKDDAKFSEFEGALKAHDWSYRMSDDRSAYKAGEEGERKIAGMKAALDKIDKERADALYARYSK